MHPVIHLAFRRAIPGPWADTAPLREELFGIERLEQHARSLAATAHGPAPGGVSRPGRYRHPCGNAANGQHQCGGPCLAQHYPAELVGRYGVGWMLLPIDVYG